MFELSNKQRQFFGLESIKPSWKKVLFKGDKYRPDSLLFYEKDIIKKHIISTEHEYKEKQYEQCTREKIFLLPKTTKGKESKLTPSTFEKCSPINCYCSVNKDGDIIIGNYNNQRTFYESDFDNLNKINKSSIQTIISNYINTCPSGYIEELNKFKKEKRRNIKYKIGDFFRFKINRSYYGFGRILLDINKLRKNSFINENHGLNLIMGPPLLIKIYTFLSENKNVDIEFLRNLPALPSDYIMDNKLFYGDYEIIGNMDLADIDMDFPISYGKSISYNRPNIVFLQWGLIHLELQTNHYSKYLKVENDRGFDQNPYGYYGVGFNPKYGSTDIKYAIEGKNIFENNSHYKSKLDLRNPKNHSIRTELLQKFGLNPKWNYLENAELAKTDNIYKIIKKINEY
jgi:hypothetical protein